MFNLFSRGKRIVGIDIEEGYIRFVEIFKSSDEDKITAYGEVLPQRTIFENSDIKDRNHFIFCLRAIKKQIRTSECFVSLPERHVEYFRVLMPGGKDGVKREDITKFLQSKNNISFDKEVFSFNSIKEEKGKTLFDVCVINKALLRRYVEILKGVNLKIKGFKFRGDALIRSCIPGGSNTSFVLVDAEVKKTYFSVVSFGRLVSFISEKTDKAKNFSHLNNIYIDWFNSQKENIHHILICGELATDESYIHFLERNTRLKIHRANTLVNLNLKEGRVPIITKSDALKFGVAIGLML